MNRVMALLIVVTVLALCTTAVAQSVTDYGKQANPATGAFPAYEIRYLSVTGAGTGGDPYVMYLEDRNNASAFTRVVSAGDYNQFAATGTLVTGYSGNCHPTVYEMSPSKWIMYSNGCPSTSFYDLSTDGGLTWGSGGGLGLNTDNGAGIAAVYDDPIGGKVHFWYQDGGGNLLYCNSGAATGDARYYSPDATTEITALAKAESGYATGFSPTGGIMVLPSGDYGLFLVAQDDSGVQLATSPVLNAGAGSWNFMFDHSNPLLPGADAGLTPPRTNLKECSITDLGGGIFGIHYDGEFGGGDGDSDEDYGYATADLNPPVYNVTQATYHWTIQGAIDAANPGNVITVDAGTYAERLNVHTPVDLRGAQYGVDPTAVGARTSPALESTIDITGIGFMNPNVAVEFPAGVAGASLAGFTVIGSPTDYYADESVVRCWDDNITIEDNILDGWIGVLYKGNDFLTVNRNRMVVNKTGVIVQPNVATNVTISNNTITPGAVLESDAQGMYMTGVTTASVTGNVASGFPNSGGCRGSNLTSVTVSGNDLSGNKDGVSFWGTTTFVTISGNDLNNNSRHGINIKGQDIVISGNRIQWNGDSGVNVEKNVLDTERVTIIDNDLRANTNYGVKVDTGAVTETVDASLNYWGPSDPFTARNEANGGVGVDYTPFLQTGTYLNPGFAGDHSELFVYADSPQVGTTGRIQEAVGLVTVGGQVKVFDGLGVFAETVHLTAPITLIGVGGPEIVPGAGFDGIDLESDDVTIQGFVIRDCDKGIQGWLDTPEYNANFGYSNVKILDNTIYNISDGSWGFGIYLGTESERYNPADPLGIYDPSLTSLLDFTGLEISGNEIHTTTGAAVVLQSMTTSGAQLEFSDNDIHGSAASGLWIDASQGIDIFDNDLSGNGNGIFFSNYGDGYYEGTPDTPYDPRDIAIYGNILRSNGGSGVAMYDAWPGLISIGPNGIYGNASYGVYNYLASTVDATNNWWGDSTGPFHGTLNPGGAGNAVSDYVTFVPYMAGNVVCDPDPLQLNVASPSGQIAVKYLGGGGGLLFGYSVTVTWDDSVADLTGVTQGNLLSDAGTTQFFAYPATGNTRTIDCSLLGAVDGVTGPGTMFTLSFDADSFGTSAVDIAIVAMRDRYNNPLSGFYEDDGEIQVDVTNPSVTGVAIENLTLTHTNEYAKNTDNLKLTATVTDDYALTAGDIKANLSLLLAGGGSAVVAEDYTANVATWTVALANVTLTADGLKTVTVTATDGLGNSGSDSDDITADNTAPGPITGFAAAPAHEEAHLSWDDPSGLDANYYGVRVQYYRWNDYPYYDPPEPSYPGTPGAGGPAFSGTGVITSGVSLWSERDIYYFGAFAYDWALNYGPGDPGAQDRSTNYWLGDVTTSLGFWDGYNGLVNPADIDKLAGTYGVAPVGFNNSECDVGPTHNNSPVGIPEPDDKVQFEDLMLFAMNYGVVAPRVVPFLPDEATKALSLELAELGAIEDGMFEVALRLEGNASEVKGLSTAIAYGSSDLEFVNARLSDDMSSPLAPVFFWHGSDGSSVQIDLAVLGTDVTVGGSGEVAVLTFRALSDEYTLEFASADLRGANNEALSAEFEGIESRPEIPASYRLVGNLPNPFNPMTKVAYQVPHESHVSIRVYDVSGRLVRTLVDGSMDPGHHEVAWDGRNDHGEHVGSGVYFCTMEADSFHGSHKMMLLK